MYVVVDAHDNHWHLIHAHGVHLENNDKQLNLNASVSMIEILVNACQQMENPTVLRS